MPRSDADMTQPTESRKIERVECPAVKEPAVRKFIVAAMFLGFGLYCAYDAFVLGKYPKPKSENINELASWAFNHIVGPFVLVPIGLVVLIWALWSLKRVLAADEAGIGYVGSEKVSWDQITRVDAARIQKGLLYLYVGEDRKITLDSWKLENFKQLVAVVESAVPQDKIKY